jgi:hypothetical protein
MTSTNLNRSLRKIKMAVVMDIAIDVLINTSIDVSFSKFKACLMKVISETRCVH